MALQIRNPTIKNAKGALSVFARIFVRPTAGRSLDCMLDMDFGVLGLCRAYPSQEGL